ncbi:MAG TPA: HXXEE domain-containing protein [Vicinamibacterales bacterium]|nr:HXXEE domain-containing protein [Vicinamibacterales bacterium]
MRWHYRDPLLVWLFPASYALHILEEWFGGFPEWLGVVSGGSGLPRGAFVAINAAAWIAMVAAARAATRSESAGWLAIGIATITLVNGVAHLLASLVTGTYSPGLFTGVILYLPLGQLALLRAWHQSPAASLRRGVIAGVLVHGLVSLVALSLSSGVRA